MKVGEALEGVARLFLDTAPVIYFVEEHPRYSPIVRFIFDRIDDGSVIAVTSPVTLAECLMAPYRLALDELRVRHNITLPDALQIATALNSGCDTFLTNDRALQRITELRVLVVDHME